MPRASATLSLLLFVTACGVSVAPTELHPSVRNAPASADDSDEARRDMALRTAAADLQCARVDIVLTFDRRYANSASVRYAIEGCGRRALYAESCETYPHCRYLQVSLVPIAAPAPAVAPPP